jgi:hypothetical protein
LTARSPRGVHDIRHGADAPPLVFAGGDFAALSAGARASAVR